MNIPADPNILKLAKEVLVSAGKGYTPEQLAEIPNIMDTKYKYWWCVDLQMWDIMPEVFVEPFEFYSNGHKVDVTCGQDQVDRSGRVCNDTMVPTHMGHNPIIQFTGEKTVRVLTRLNDYHTYNDDDSTYEGWALYVDDFVKCDDGVWRIQTLRLTYRKILGGLRTHG
ncbi:MAG: nuclear transport factor 2 family protein [Oscillospiraceae bacterium]